jgi:RHS repeat-associated protein
MAVLAADGQLQEFYMRGVGVDRDIGSLVAATHYISGSPPATYYLHNNHRGDVILARQGTNTVATLEYAPYGELRSYSGTYTPRFRFSSKEIDASTGFYHFPYRYYAPQWTRWVTRDPVGFYAGDMNVYRYAFSSPLVFVDALGLEVQCAPFNVTVRYGTWRTVRTWITEDDWIMHPSQAGPLLGGGAGIQVLCQWSKAFWKNTLKERTVVIEGLYECFNTCTGDHWLQHQRHTRTQEDISTRLDHIKRKYFWFPYLGSDPGQAERDHLCSQKEGLAS